MKILIKRNIKIFFRDKSAVLFSLLAVFIIIALYAVFLGDVWLDDSMQNIKGADILMNTWLTAGLLAVTSITTTMGAFGIMIDDKVRKINKDFYSSPIKRSQITMGYIGSAFFIGVILSVITVFVSEIYIVFRGGEWMTPLVLLKVIILVIFTTAANTSIVCFIVSFFKSHSAFSTASTIISTLIGFLTGIYLPIGALPESVQTVIKVFPVSHAAALLRQVLMEDAMRSSFSELPAGYLNKFKEYMGVTFRFGNSDIPSWASVFILAATATLFYGLSLFNLSKRIQ
jgi:multidrug/hemolysin transport system permease protein